MTWYRHGSPRPRYSNQRWPNGWLFESKLRRDPSKSFFNTIDPKLPSGTYDSPALLYDALIPERGVVQFFDTQRRAGAAGYAHLLGRLKEFHGQRATTIAVVDISKSFRSICSASGRPQGADRAKALYCSTNYLGSQMKLRARAAVSMPST